MGTVTFTVLVTGQDGDTQTVTWTSTRNDAKFAFVDSVAGNDVNDGSWANPYQTFIDGLWQGSGVDATNAGKIAVFIGNGPYTVGDGTVASHNLTMNVNTKPATLMAFPGDTPTLDTSNAHFWSNNTNQTDLSVIGLHFDGSRPDANNMRVFNLGAVSDGQIFWDNFVNGSPAPALLQLSDFDGNGKLAGSARTTWLGLRGAEIASVGGGPSNGTAGGSASLTPLTASGTALAGLGNGTASGSATLSALTATGSASAGVANGTASLAPLVASGTAATNAPNNPATGIPDIILV